MMRKNGEFAMIMEALAGINTKMEDMGKRLDVLEGKATEGKAKEAKKESAKETTSKGKAKKATTNKSSKGKKSAPATVEKKTKAEAIEEWKSSRYTADERKAYGEAAKAVREEMMAENKKKVKVVKGEKVYADDYFVGSKWTKEFNKRMKARGFEK